MFFLQNVGFRVAVWGIMGLIKFLFSFKYRQEKRWTSWGHQNSMSRIAEFDVKSDCIHMQFARARTCHARSRTCYARTTHVLPWKLWFISFFSKINEPLYICYKWRGGWTHATCFANLQCEIECFYVNVITHVFARAAHVPHVLILHP